MGMWIVPAARLNELVDVWVGGRPGDVVGWGEEEGGDS